jgi:DNA-binding PadR family transcriptional regulator
VSDLNPTAAAILGFLEAGELSGYDLAKAATEIIGDFWHVTRSQVYRELAQLAGSGLVERGDTAARARQPYRLTESGRAAFIDWIAQPPPQEQVRYPLLLTIAFGSWLGPERLLEMASAHRPDHERRLATYRAYMRDEGLDQYQRATVVFGIAYEEAVLRWLDQLPAVLAGAPVRPGSSAASASSPAPARSTAPRRTPPAGPRPGR